MNSQLFFSYIYIWLMASFCVTHGATSWMQRRISCISRSHGDRLLTVFALGALLKLRQKKEVKLVKQKSDRTAMGVTH